MEQFLYDYINLTQGQLFLKYWQLWLAVSVVLMGFSLWWKSSRK